MLGRWKKNPVLFLAINKFPLFSTNVNVYILFKTVMYKVNKVINRFKNNDSLVSD